LQSCGNVSTAWRILTPTRSGLNIIRGHAGGCFCTALVLVIGCLGCADARAEFFVWYDDEGHKHVSNVAAQGFTGDGDVRGAYDPRSIVYQHARMLDKLTQQGREIAFERDNERRRSEVELPAERKSMVRAASGGRMLNLDELIALEKRGGRLP
jgi:hypothetical protein